MKIKTLLISLALCMSTGGFAQEACYTRAAFPQVEGTRLHYRYKGSGKNKESSCILTVKDVVGSNSAGSLTMVYNCFDANGKPYFDGENEFVMSAVMENGETYITMDKMAKTLKVMDMITAGDASSIKVPMTVGDMLPSTVIHTTLGPFNATVTVSQRQVLNHKTINVGGHDYECWLVQEYTLTKTPFGTSKEKALTWYAEGVGCVKQSVFDSKGNLRGVLELVRKER